MDMLQLQEQFIAELLEPIASPWERITVHYEHFEWSTGESEKYVATLTHGSTTIDLDLSLEAIDALLALQAQVPEGQSEPWTWVEFSIDDTGRYDFNYQYGVPPLTADYLRRQAAGD